MAERASPNPNTVHTPLLPKPAASSPPSPSNTRYIFPLMVFGAGALTAIGGGVAHRTEWRPEVTAWLFQIGAPLVTTVLGAAGVAIQFFQKPGHTLTNNVPLRDVEKGELSNDQLWKQQIERCIDGLYKSLNIPQTDVGSVNNDVAPIETRISDKLKTVQSKVDEALAVVTDDVQRNKFLTELISNFSLKPPAGQPAPVNYEPGNLASLIQSNQEKEALVRSHLGRLQNLAVKILARGVSSAPASPSSAASNGSPPRRAMASPGGEVDQDLIALLTGLQSPAK